MVQRTGIPSMGILNLQGGEQNFRLMRYSPAETLKPFVLHYWTVSWDLKGLPPYDQHVVPNPCVNLVVERNRTAIYGPAKEKFSSRLSGKGCVFGVKFRPGGFYPFYRQPVSGWNGSPLPIHQALNINSDQLEALILHQTSEEHMVTEMERILINSMPGPDGMIERIHSIIEQIKHDRSLTKVDELCETLSMNKRTLQRLFEQYVGVSPKWVIQLYRLQNAAERLEAALTADWAGLSAELGYYDQSHFIKDFRTVIGQTPEEYVMGLQRKEGH
ncbi:DUF6597 domain-containing transcriptional factor [Paenibacillus gansuensis]|uniref:DUF6597 domain-containing transcriptional factor n=1 Tax=Paenibacillus gansuensis TaxID=306542 RepID=A0ABW5PIV0_9BACL